jgi:magnesium-transporting ATPase (P-type)
MQQGDYISMSNISAKNIFTQKRPLGVWVLTICALIFAGSNLLLSDSFLVLKGEVAMFRSDQVPRMLLWAYLNIGIIIASILTWAGWELGRIFFLFLTSIFYVDQGIGTFLWITHRDFGKAPMGEQIYSWLQLMGCILIPILYIWYFNRPSTKKFFRKVEKDVIDQ